MPPVLLLLLLLKTPLHCEITVLTAQIAVIILQPRVNCLIHEGLVCKNRLYMLDCDFLIILKRVLLQSCERVNRINYNQISHNVSVSYICLYTKGQRIRFPSVSQRELDINARYQVHISQLRTDTHELLSTDNFILAEKCDLKHYFLRFRDNFPFVRPRWELVLFFDIQDGLHYNVAFLHYKESLRHFANIIQHLVCVEIYLSQGQVELCYSFRRPSLHKLQLTQKVMSCLLLQIFEVRYLVLKRCKIQLPTNTGF